MVHKFGMLHIGSIKQLICSFGGERTRPKKTKMPLASITQLAPSLGLLEGLIHSQERPPPPLTWGPACARSLATAPAAGLRARLPQRRPSREARARSRQHRPRLRCRPPVEAPTTGPPADPCDRHSQRRCGTSAPAEAGRTGSEGPARGRASGGGDRWRGAGQRRRRPAAVCNTQNHIFGVCRRQISQVYM